VERLNGLNGLNRLIDLIGLFGLIRGSALCLATESRFPLCGGTGTLGVIVKVTIEITDVSASFIDLYRTLVASRFS
jgi:hypothetical protein